MYLQKEPSKFLSNSMEPFKKASNIFGHPNFGFMTKLNRDFIMNITISLIPWLRFGFGVFDCGVFWVGWLGGVFCQRKRFFLEFSKRLKGWGTMP